MEQVVITNKKLKSVVSSRTNVSAADTAYVNISSGFVDIQDSITTSVLVTFTANTSNANVMLGLYDKDQTLIGVTPEAQFVSTTYKGSDDKYVSPRYLFDTGEAIFVYPVVTVVNAGNINVKVKPLG